MKLLCRFSETWPSAASASHDCGAPHATTRYTRTIIRMPAMRPTTVSFYILVGRDASVQSIIIVNI